VIVARDLHLSRGATEVLRGVSLCAAAGEVLALVGPNGAGKSTLLAALSGSLPPSAGSVTLHGRPLGQWAPGPLARVRALLAQQHDLGFAFTVEEVVALGRYPHGPDPGDAARVTRSLERVGALHLRERAWTRLSGGERQRVALARVLCQLDGAGPRLLLLDEPTSAQDLAQQRRVLGIARAFADEGNAVVVVLHDLNLAALVADRLVLLQRGEVLARGTPSEVLTVPTLQRAFGTTPQVVHLDARPVVLPTALADDQPSPSSVESPWPPNADLEP